MALRFASSTAYLTQGTATLPQGTSSGGSLLFWAYPEWAQNDNAGHCLFDQWIDNNNNFTFIKRTTNALAVGWVTGSTDFRASVAVGSYTLNQNAWNCLLGVWSEGGGANEFTHLYLNGTKVAERIGSFNTTSLATKVRYLGRVDGGRSISGNYAWVGSVAEYAVWNTPLNALEAAALAAGCSPRRVATASLVDYLPVWGVGATEINCVGGGTQGTLVGSPTVVTGPPVEPFARRFWGIAHDATAAPAPTGNPWYAYAQQ